jgi:acyl carrier protein
MTADLTASVVGILSEMLPSKPAVIGEDTRLFEDLGFDSTNVLELLMQLEDHLGVEFDPYLIEPQDFATIASVVEFISRQVLA